YMARIAIVFALTVTLLGVSGLASRAQSGPPNYSEDQRMSMCRAMFRGTIAKCECILKTMHKRITREHANIIFWLNYDNPSAARDREREEGAARMVGGEEAVVRDHVERLLAAVIRMRAPADIGQETGRVTQPPLLRVFLKARGIHEAVGPADQFLAMLRGTRA